MRRHYATSENRERTSKSMMHRPKVCSYCGQEGHNRKGCPELKQKEAEAEADSQTAEAASSAQEAAAPLEGSMTGQAPSAQEAALPVLPSAAQQATRCLPLPRQDDAEATSGLDLQPDVSAACGIDAGTAACNCKCHLSLYCANRKCKATAAATRRMTPIACCLSIVDSASNLSLSILQQEEAGTAAERKGPSRTRINPRSCSVCGEPGHDIRNCPVRCSLYPSCICFALQRLWM